MNRNQTIIVKETGNCYELFLTGGTEDGILYYSRFPCEEFQPLSKITGNYMVLPNPYPGRRIFFGVRTPGGLTYAAPLFIPLEKTENLRDLGGYLAADGRSVKWGLFYRSGALLPAGFGEQKLLDSLGLKTILDYRSPDEAAKSPDYLPAGAVHCPAPAFDASDELKLKMTNMDMARQLMSLSSLADVTELEREFRGIYKLLPFRNPAYQKMFSLLDEGGAPLLQHCSAGKDRTGIGCALLLLALGVDEETVIGDYCLSALYRQKTNSGYLSQMETQGLPDYILKAAAMLLSVQRDFIVSALNEIKRRYPDYGTFLKEEYGITKSQQEHWANIYLAENTQK